MQPPTTTAPEGASMEEVARGMHHGGATESEKDEDAAGDPSASAGAHTRSAYST